MGCSCNQKRKQFEVVASGGAGKVLYTSGSEATCNAVAKRYPDSIVREKEKATTAAKTAAAATT